MKSFIFSAVAMLLVIGTTGCRSDKPAPSTRPVVSLADFFAYSCVQAYTRKHALPEFDGSVAHAVEYSSGSADDFSRLYEQAEAFAAMMPAPDMSDPEHGRVAVMARCLEQSRKL